MDFQALKLDLQAFLLDLQGYLVGFLGSYWISRLLLDFQAIGDFQTLLGFPGTFGIFRVFSWISRLFKRTSMLSKRISCVCLAEFQTSVEF